MKCVSGFRAIAERRYVIDYAFSKIFLYKNENNISWGESSTALFVNGFFFEILLHIILIGRTLNLFGNILKWGPLI